MIPPPEIPGPLPIFGSPPLGFRFYVVFYTAGVVPNPIDIFFKRVSGIGGSIKTTTLQEGGQNLYSHKLPDRVQYQNLLLERGLMVGSPLSVEFNVAMSSFRFLPSNVQVSLLDNTWAHTAVWLFMNAYPVKWKISDLDAAKNEVVIESLELCYQRMQSITL